MRELFQVWSNALDDEQIDAITAAALNQPDQDAIIFSAANDLQDLRRSIIRWMPDQWVQDLLWGYVQQANANGFDVDVTNTADVQFTEYHMTDGGHYGWHHDINWNGQTPEDRKLSVTVQLSDPSTYDGGEFEFEDVQTTADFRSKGTVLVFPSYLRHRIKPVTKGTRRSLVAWFSGPRWR